MSAAEIGEDASGSERDQQEALRREVASLRTRVEVLERALERGLQRDPSVPPQRAAPPAAAPPAQHPQPLHSSPFAPVPPFVPTAVPQPPIERRSLESRIGSFFVNRIGVVAVMIGMALFLKLAVDRHWIGPPAYIAIGLAVSIGLVLWSERFRRRGFDGFSYSLKALGTGVGYLTVWAAYSVYALISAEAAFAAMVVVTAVNGVLAWLQDSELLAVYALAGGLATPALLSTGQNHELFLFSYLLLLDLAAVVLSAVKPWNRLILGSFVGTVVYFGMWWGVYYTPDAFAPTGVFLLLFFAVFTAAPLLALPLSGFRAGRAPLAEPSPLAAYDPLFREFLVTMLPPAVHVTAFAAAWYWVGTYRVGTRDLEWLRSWLALGLALASLGVDLMVRSIEDNDFGAGIPAGRRAADRLADIHFGLAIFFVALAAWIEFDQHHFSLPQLAACWLAESLVLVAVVTLVPPHHHHPATAADHVTLPRCYANLLLLVSTVTLLLLESLDPPAYFTRPILNSHFATYLAGLGVFAATAWLCGRAMEAHARDAETAVEGSPAASTSGPLPELSARRRASVVEPGSLVFLVGLAVVAFNFVALVAGAVQIHLYWVRDDLERSALRLPAAGPHTVGFSYSAWFMAYGALLMAAGFVRRSAYLRWQALVLLAFAIGKVFVVDASRLSQGYRAMSFLGLGALLLTISFAYQRDWLALRKRD